MKVAFPENLDLYSRPWVEYCEAHDIEYKLVDVYAPDIIEQVRDCDAFLWHHNHADYRDALFAKQLLFSLQQAGKRVWPDYKTGWHFDDKLGESLLFDSLGLPMVPYHVFYDKERALEWCKTAKYPLVFKLRGGAGSANVRLVKTESAARKLIKRAFGKGFAAFNRWFVVYTRYKKWRAGHDTFLGVCKGAAHSMLGGMFDMRSLSIQFARMHPREKGYIYFQEFMPGNDRDYRVIVIGGRAFAYYRLVRKGDFRASGSGEFFYDNFPPEIIALAFEAAKRMGTQCVAFDFVYSPDGRPLIVESSYCFGFDQTDAENGYWTPDLQYHPGCFNPFHWIIDDCLNRTSL